jgi:regulator of nucleoside diphosphate kinase
MHRPPDGAYLSDFRFNRQEQRSSNMVAANTISVNPKLVMSEVDFDRLNELVQSPRYRMTHASLLTGLRQELARGKVVAPLEIPRGVVTMRSRVRVRDLRDKQVETYMLVYPDEADINQNKLSVLAPLGTALLGARAGQTITVHVPAGVRRLKVERILYQPEAAGDLHL